MSESSPFVITDEVEFEKIIDKDSVIEKIAGGF